MKTKTLSCAALALLLLSGCGTTVDPDKNRPERFPSVGASLSEYRIGAGDVLSVIMPYNPELNFEAPVGPDGRFTMPVAGTVPLAGLTVPEAGAAIDAALARQKVVGEAHASVSIRHYAQVVYVGGEVSRPGTVALRSAMDPLQAITAAGGLLDTARSKEIVLIRPGEDGKPMLRTVDLDALIGTGDHTQAVALLPRDTIFVPRSSIAEVDLWVEQYINRTLPFNRSFSYTINTNANSQTTTQ